ncbi:MAG: hypothetical protein U5R49_22020 [Deltaproteobacteria bacterium]|nr:hypothetical protein [Deltaproteobacteria bacterium]
MFKRTGRWYSDFWHDGRRYTKSHGPVSKTIASEKDRKFRTDVASGEYRRKMDNPIFSEAMKEHLKKSKTKSSYKRNVLSAGHLNGFFGNKRIRSIENNQDLMQKYVDSRQEAIREKQLKQGRDESEVSLHVDQQGACLDALDV